MSGVADVQVREGLVYEDRPTGPLALDLHVPQGRVRPPVVLYAHGGGWLGGRRTDFADRLSALAAQGVAVASIDYRTVDLAAWPAQGHDVLAAAAWLREHADELGVSGDPVVLMGSSAGAHVVTLTALSSPSPDVAGIVALFGRHDLAATAPKPAAHLEVPAVIRADAPPAGFEHLDQRGKLALLAGVPVADLTAERLAELSPVHHAGPDAPPVFLAHGTADALVHHSHALRLAGALADAPSRSEVTLVLVPGANHEDDAFADPRFLGSVAAFVDRCTAPLTSSAR